MGNYANSSLEERIARRRKQRRQKQQKMLLICAAAIVAILLLVGLGFGVASLFSGDDTEEPTKITETVDGEENKEPATQPESQPETPTTPEEKPEEDGPPPAEAEPETPATPEVPATPGEDITFVAVSADIVGKAVADYGAKAATSVFLTTYNSANSRLSGNKVNPDKPMVAITFDDGPSKKYGPRILDTLQKYGARATFFVLGELVEGNSANLKRAVDMGCEIGNHTYDHTTLTKLSAEDISSQINRTNDLVKKATGKPATLVRTPGGAVNKLVKSTVNAPIINWSLDTVDWKSRNTDAIVKIVLDNVKDGDIILLHEIYGTTADAADKIIPELIKRGYQLVTVSELMEAREVKLEKGKVYFSAYPKKKAE